MKKTIYTYAVILGLILGSLYFKIGNSNLLSPLNDPNVCKVIRMMNVLKHDVPDNVKIPVAIAIASHSSSYNIPKETLVAVAFKESTFNPKAVNRSGDRGVMQVNNFWGKPYYDREEDLFNPYKCVETACKMIKANEMKGKGIEFYHSWNVRDRIAYKKELIKLIRRLEDV